MTIPELFSAAILDFTWREAAMCGDLDEDAQIGQQLLERLKVMTRMLGIAVEPAPGSSGPDGLATIAGRTAYMETLFNAGLTRALNDTAAVASEAAVDAIACQAIAFARLAGFLAGQLPPEADLFRTTLDAMMAGHAETTRLVGAYRHEQDHLHGHAHDHHH
jgi:hypothetical protein